MINQTTGISLHWRVSCVQYVFTFQTVSYVSGGCQGFDGPRSEECRSVGPHDGLSTRWQHQWMVRRTLCSLVCLQGAGIVGLSDG